MKKFIATLLALVFMLTFTACGGEGSGTQSETENSGGSVLENSGSIIGDVSGTGTGECYLCIDYEDPTDRKCDTCGNWIYPKGEVWTNAVPDNVKVTVEDNNFFYIIEKIGDKFYTKMWSDKSSYEKGEEPYEDFTLLDMAYNRNPGGEWKEASFIITYADVYELFAVEILQVLTGSTVSSNVQECLDVPAVKTETIAGKECQVKEYDGLFGVKYRVWFWNNLPLKKEHKNTDSDDFELLYEIYEWDTGITEFSTDVPA